MRVWILARRDEMHDDPVVFIISDWRSQLMILFGAILLAVAHSDERQRSRVLVGSSRRRRCDQGCRCDQAAEGRRRATEEPCSPTATAAAMATRCLNAAGTLIDMRAMNRILGFDPQTGVHRGRSRHAALRHHRASPRRTASSRRSCRARSSSRSAAPSPMTCTARTIIAAVRSAATSRRFPCCAPTAAPSLLASRELARSSRRRSAAWGLPASSFQRRSG